MSTSSTGSVLEYKHLTLVPCEQDVDFLKVGASVKKSVNLDGYLCLDKESAEFELAGIPSSNEYQYLNLRVDQC